MNQPSDCRKLALTDIDEAARVISLAFMEDPLCVYMLPSRRYRLGTLIKFFRAYSQVSIQAERGYGVGRPLQGVAFWKTPHQPELSISLKSLGIFLPIAFTPYLAGQRRARPILKRIDELHARHAPDSHYYLDNIGVLPEARGQGAASRLIYPFLQQADQDRLPAYTDTVTQANVGLYEHFGFHVVEESPVEGTGVTVWALFRQGSRDEK